MDNARERVVSMLSFALNDIENERPTSAKSEPSSSSASSSLPSDIDINTVRAIKDTFLTSSSFRLPASDFKDLIRRARSLLQKESMFNRISCSGETHVVGDLHGSLEDLARIISLKGYPSSTNKYIFNGDFVDRGPRSVEVLSIILGLKIACPEDVFLNRGNHEDHAICTMYGFKDEIQDKYTRSMTSVWSEICKLFAALPLGTLLETSRVFTSHAGPPDASIDINKDDHVDLTSSLMNDDVDQRFVNVLWSDPDVTEVETRMNDKRGCGIIYGPDEVRNFLLSHDLRTFVRSHECVMNGVEYIDCGEDTHMYTVFSASCYPNFEGFNEAAVLTFKHDDHNPEITQFESEELDFSHEINIDDESLHKRIYDCKDELLNDFEQESTDRRRVTISQWCTIMERFIGPMDWLDLQAQIAPEVMRVRDGKVESTNEIAFDRFLSHYDSEKISKEEELHSETSYRVQRHLFRLFTSLDVNHDGEISRSEFKSGIHALNRRLPENSRICHNDEDGLNTLFDTLDLDSSGDICVHEFSGLIERMIEDEFSSSSPPS
eukprot:g2576.t1